MHVRNGAHAHHSRLDGLNDKETLLADDRPGLRFDPVTLNYHITALKSASADQLKDMLDDAASGIDHHTFWNDRSHAMVCARVLMKRGQDLDTKTNLHFLDNAVRMLKAWKADGNRLFPDDSGYLRRLAAHCVELFTDGRFGESNNDRKLAATLCEELDTVVDGLSVGWHGLVTEPFRAAFA